MPVLEVDDASNVEYRTMADADVAAVLPVIARAFHEGEPVTGVGKSTLEDWTRFSQMYLPRMAAEGNTIIAVDTGTQAVLGAFLNEDYCNTDPPEFDAFAGAAEGDWEPCLTMVGEIEDTFNAAHGVPQHDRPPGRWFHLWMIGVDSHARGRSIGRKLCTHSIAWAKARGFEVAFAECTGAISTHLLTKHTGASVESFIDYSQWDGCGTAATLRGLPAAGHPGMSLTVVRLLP